MRKLIRFFYHFFLLASGGLLFLAAWSPTIDPARFWPAAFLGLTFPIWWILVFVLWLTALLFRTWWIVVPTLAMAGSWKAMRVSFALPFGNKPVLDTTRPVIKLMSYNVRDFRPYDDRSDPHAQFSRAMLQIIANQQADVLCLQEFYTSENPRLPHKNFKRYISDSLGYPYRYFSSDYNALGSTSHSGVIIFSRWPICRAGKIPIIYQPREESLIYADLVIHTDTVRVFTVHLQSIYLNRVDLMQIEEMKHGKDTAWITSKPIWGKLKRAFIRRSSESKLVKQVIDQSPYPVILCGDFNDTPVSFTYFTLAKGMQDGFLNRDFGFGSTYYSIFPTLRIDYILASQQWQFLQFKRIPVHLSDHYPIVAELQLRSISSVKP
ncbi:MAG: endonuclease/exonuclease/phosphatase family protein [Thermoflavifilum sp.]|nr:endonuclease/exonuclease/phosphatase family protein [Thermoflavifilum sp.]